MLESHITAHILYYKIVPLSLSKLLFQDGNLIYPLPLTAIQTKMLYHLLQN